MTSLAPGKRMVKDDPALVKRVQETYARVGWKATLNRFAFSSKKLARIIEDHGLEPIPKTHVKVTDLAIETNRHYQAVVYAAKAAGVLRRTKAPGALQAAARSVPAAWAKEYAIAAALHDTVHECFASGWYSNTRIGELTGQTEGVIARARDGIGLLAPYLADVERHTATNGHTAWNPREADAAIDAFHADRRKAEGMTCLADFARGLGRSPTQVEDFAKRRGIYAARLPRPDQNRIGVYLANADAKTLRDEYAELDLP